MKISKQKNKSKCALKLDGEMTIYTAMENKTNFEPYFSVEQDISVDLSTVNEFDSTGFQMLLLLERQALSHANLFTVSKCSPAVNDVLSLYNKEDWLNY